MEPKKSRLGELGDRLQTVDFLSVDLLKRRMDLALDVIEEKVREAEKEGKTPKIFRSKIETKRLAEIARHARKIGLNPHFARMMLYAAIDESCKIQMIKLQGAAGRAKKEPDELQKNLVFRKNLLKLTRLVAPKYDDDYGKAFFATRAHLAFEQSLLEREIKALPDRALMLDLGCATGRVACQFGNVFDRVVGYDLSEDMVHVATAKAAKRGLSSVEFRVADLEKGIPEADSSISLVVMNLGTASDMQNIAGVIGEVRRVLEPGGRFLLSFYNRLALLYQWGFIPWEVGLAALVNINRNCLEVHVNKKLLSVFARAYAVKEVRELCQNEQGFVVEGVATHPTMCSILPTDLLENQPDAQKVMAALDEKLSRGTGGAYIIVTGVKR